MAELPTGTITLLFGDVEGPTALLSRLGDRYGEVLSAQRALQREACAAHGGREMEAEGASFFVVFQSAADAVRCCVAAQRALAGLQERFPPLKTLGAQTSLPVPMTPLVGREGDLEEVRAAVAQPGIRLVTLTGTGGVGKTRLALAAVSSLASAFPHGVFFVGLAAVRDTEVMWKTIAGDLNAGDDGPAADIVTGYLAERRALLVLDNLEQLDGACDVVAALLEAAPRLVVLATSRRPLHLQGEHEYPVPPLELPPGAGVPEVAASGAVRLFVQQAEMVRPGFTVTAGNGADIAEICRRLDGLPLAIELAASRVRLLAPSALLSRLGDSLDLAAADMGRPSRQQTLRNTIAWSYQLLAADLARVFRRLGAFAGGCDLDALASVAVAEDDSGPAAMADPLELAAGLLDVSLITVTEGADGEPRVGMLETIREYALERLAVAGELDDTRRRHAEYCAGLAERARAQLGGPAYLAALGRLEAEHGNLRAALAWSLDTRARGPAGDGEQVAIGLRLAQALEASACIAAELGEGLRAARLAGAAAGIRDTGGMPIPEPDAELLERFLGPLRATVPHEIWNAELAAGRALTQEQAGTLLVSSST